MTDRHATNTRILNYLYTSAIDTRIIRAPSRGAAAAGQALPQNKSHAHAHNSTAGSSSHFEQSISNI